MSPSDKPSISIRNPFYEFLAYMTEYPGEKRHLLDTISAAKRIIYDEALLPFII